MVVVEGSGGLRGTPPRHETTPSDVPNPGDARYVAGRSGANTRDRGKSIGAGVGGRPTRLTPALQERIADAIRAGAWFSTACECAGVRPSLAYEWIRRGKGLHRSRVSTPAFAEFAHTLARANADAEMSAQAPLVEAGRRDWRAALAFLERRFPERWALRRYEVLRSNAVEWEDPPPQAAPPGTERIASILEVLADAGVVLPVPDAEGGCT